MVTCPICKEGKLVFNRVEETRINHSGTTYCKTKKENIYKCNKAGCPCELSEKDVQAERELQKATGKV